MDIILKIIEAWFILATIVALLWIGLFAGRSRVED